MSESFENRRKFVRVYRHFILTYHPVNVNDPSAQKEVSQINNLSQGGMSFSVNSPLQVGDQLVIELKTPFLAESVNLQGEILACREKIVGLIYEVRLEFKELSVQAKEVLVKIEQYAHRTS